MTEEEFIAQFKAGAGYLLDAIHEGSIIYDTGFLKRIIPQSKQELEAKGIRRVGNVLISFIKNFRLFLIIKKDNFK
jgi:hypothetical protein